MPGSAWPAPRRVRQPDSPACPAVTVCSVEGFHAEIADRRGRRVAGELEDVDRVEQIHAVHIGMTRTALKQTGEDG